MSDFRDIVDRHRPFVLGLTGAFGSGCSTVAEHCQQVDARYDVVSISAELRRILAEKGTDKPTRKQLQDLGDELRSPDRYHAIVELALRRALAQTPPPECIVIDAVRNLGEVRWLQKVLGDRFALMAVYANYEERFRRYEERYTSRQEFDDDDARDQEEEEAFGQQVRRCVDNADAFVLNDERIDDEFRREDVLKAKLRHLLPIVEGKATEYATSEEVLMNLSWSASHGSKCLKRQVGAVIARGAEPIATGYNENPDGMLPCIDQFSGTCLRDRIRHDHFVDLVGKGWHCPNCTAKLEEVPLPPNWACATCGQSLDRAFFPDRAMRWCTALHAEERAIINSRGTNLEGATMYSTTAPCTLCAEKIIHAGIAEVVFVDAYPDETGRALFDIAGVELRLFEGVRSRNFHRYFVGVQETKENEAVGKIAARAQRINTKRSEGAVELTGGAPAPVSETPEPLRDDGEGVKTQAAEAMTAATEDQRPSPASPASAPSAPSPSPQTQDHPAE